jgi:hypothetical protein
MHYPQKYKDESPTTYTKLLINVGATDINGKTTDFSQGHVPNGKLLTTSALGQGITCMSNVGNAIQSNKKGTSYAALQVAGVAALLMTSSTGLHPYVAGSEGAYVQKVYEKIQTLHWQRPEGDTPMLWNGIEGDVIPEITKEDYDSDTRRILGDGSSSENGGSDTKMTGT